MLSQDERWLLEEKYGGEKSPGFFADCERLASGEPLGYVIGWVPFLDCKIWLDERPLIPRPETEWWVEKAIGSVQEAVTTLKTQLVLAQGSFAADASLSKQLPPPTNPTTTETEPAADLVKERLEMGGFGWGISGAKESSPPPVPSSQVTILDLCAGSGCIGVAVAKAVPGARVDFGEIDARFLPTILKNLAENGIDSARSNLIKSDLFTSITDRYDFILTNPPYIDPALDRTEASVKEYEPHHALYGGRDGFELIEHIVAATPTHLTPGGQLWIEHEPEQASALAALARHHHLTVVTHPDQYQIPRFSVLTMK